MDWPRVSCPLDSQLTCESCGSRSIIVSGRGADAVVNGGCPQDLSLGAFPVGAASRTVLGKIEIVLWRTAEDTFRVECWRSFSGYAYGFLQESARDVAV